MWIMNSRNLWSHLLLQRQKMLHVQSVNMLLRGIRQGQPVNFFNLFIYIRKGRVRAEDDMVIAKDFNRP